MVEPGTQVQAGDVIVKVDLEVLTANGKSTVTPVVITTPDKIKSINVNLGKNKSTAATLSLV